MKLKTINAILAKRADDFGQLILSNGSEISHVKSVSEITVEEGEKGEKLLSIELATSNTTLIIDADRIAGVKINPAKSK